MSFPKFAVFIRSIFKRKWVYSYFEKSCRKKCARDNMIPKDNMGYDQYTVPNDCSCRTYFGCFPLAIASITSQTSCIILLNFSEEQCTQNHPKYLSGLSRALFPTTFLEIAVGTFKECAHAVFSNFRLNKTGTVY